MLFNSAEFLCFFSLVFFSYWLLVGKYLRVQNIFLLTVSYLFYGWWDWRFLSLIAISTLMDYWIARCLFIFTKQRLRRLLLMLSIGMNIGMLAFFKYYGFFLESLASAFPFFEIGKGSTLQIILPVGISFYTFQTLSYTIDVYRKKLKPTNDLVAFASFVSFFPQLVAGPIERATQLLPQFEKRRVFNYVKGVDGSKTNTLGFFQEDGHCG